jgi:uncharacterized protein YlaI
MEKVEAELIKIWEFQCPYCGKFDEVDDDEFISFLNNYGECEYQCQGCKKEFIVTNK